MRRTYGVPVARAGLVAAAAVLVLLVPAGTGIAGDAQASAREATKANSTPLAWGAGYGSADGSRRVKVLQRRLRALGWRPGPVDGLFGPRTNAAVLRFQAARGLAADGIVGRHTKRALARVGRGSKRLRRVDRRPRRGSGDRVAPQTATGARYDTGEVADDPGRTGTSIRPGPAVAGLALLAVLVGIPLRRPARIRRAPAVPAAPPRPEPVVSVAGEVRALGYVSVPKANGAHPQALSDQAAAVDRCCEQRGWRLLEVVRDGENGKARGLERPGLAYALERIERGEASCLVVSELERVSRSASDLGHLLERLGRNETRFVVLDVGLDTGTPEGAVATRALMSVGSLEGRWLAQRTRDGLAAARARRVATGRPAVADMPALEQRIVAMRAEGMTLQAIADRLNADGVPTLRGGALWRPSSVQSAAGYRRPRREREAGGSA